MKLNQCHTSKHIGAQGVQFDILDTFANRIGCTLCLKLIYADEQVNT